MCETLRLGYNSGGLANVVGSVVSIADPEIA